MAKVEELRELRLAFKKMLESEAWAKLVAVAEEQAALRLQNSVGPMESLSEAFKRNFALGERAGILLFVKLPQTILERLDEEIEELKEKEEGE